MPLAVDVRSVGKRYGTITALTNVSLEIQSGEIFGLLGANGAGKTTLIKILVGALKYDEGAVQVLGMEPNTRKHDLRPQIGYMPQQTALYEDLSARENVRFFGRAQHIPDLETKIWDVLNFLDLSNRIDDPIYGFSGGMRQRVSLACALVHEPKLLLLDEPSTGIDPRLREMLWTYFRDLTRQGTTIVVSTHQMDEALHCDRVAVMRMGSVLAEDSPYTLLKRGKARIRISRKGEVEEHQLDHYRDELPRLLGLNSEIELIEVQEDTLEKVVLDLISAREEYHD